MVKGLIIFAPTDEDKKEVEKICCDFIFSLEKKDIGFKSYCLKVLTESFVDHYGVEAIQLISTKK